MLLPHIPNGITKLAIQRQTADYIKKTEVQLYLATNFPNQENGETVWGGGFSIQLEQIPQLIELLQKTYEKYSGKKTIATAKTEKTVTFADVEQ